MSESQHLSIHIERSAADVYDYVRDPANLPEWAEGLGGTVEEREGRWFATMPEGEVEISFAPENEYGVVDHEVTLPDGTTFPNPMRVLPDGDGCEVVFTLRRQPDTDDEEHTSDAEAIRSDLAKLKATLEG